MRRRARTSCLLKAILVVMMCGVCPSRHYSEQNSIDCVWYVYTLSLPTTRAKWLVAEIVCHSLVVIVEVSSVINLSTLSKL